MDHRTAGRPAPGTPRSVVGQYEYRLLTLDPRTGHAEARTILTEEAEYGRWELARTRLYTGGLRKVWLRRKIMRVRSTL